MDEGFEELPIEDENRVVSDEANELEKEENEEHDDVVERVVINEESVEIENKKLKADHNIPQQKKLQKTSRWILFLSDNRKRYIDENPGLTFPQVTKKLAELYKNLSPEEVEQLEQRVQEHNKVVEETAEVEQLDDDKVNQSPASLVIPLARVKKCMKLDPDVKNISKESIAVMTKAVELFIGRLTIKTQATTALRGGKSIKLNDFIHTIHYEPSLDFLRMDFPKSMLQTSTNTASTQRAATKAKAVNSSDDQPERDFKENQSESNNTNILPGDSGKEVKRASGSSIINEKNNIANYFTGKKRSMSENATEDNASNLNEVTSEEVANKED